MIETDRSWGSVGNALTSCSACTVVATGAGATPETLIEVDAPPAPPAGIARDRLDPQAFAEMPMPQALRELKSIQARRRP